MGDQSTLAPRELDNVANKLAALARDTYTQHMLDVEDAHRWLERFFETLTSESANENVTQQQPPTSATTTKHRNARHAMTELMKTPGKSRLLHSRQASANKQPQQDHSISKVAKDPLATLLFHTSQHRSANSNKENSPAAAPAASSTRQTHKPSSTSLMSSATVRSPLRPAASAQSHSTSSSSNSNKRQPTLKQTSSLSSIANLPTSPMLADVQAFEAPAATSEPNNDEHDDDNDVDMHQSEASQDAKEHAKTATHRADLSQVLEEDDEQDTAGMDVDPDDVNQDVSHFSTASTVHQDEHPDLSIIGEEAEDGEEAAENASAANAHAATTAATDVSMRMPETVHAETQADKTATQHPPKPRVASNASSVADEADADVAIPLNDAPSALRSNQNPLSSSVPASAGNPHATRTPGGTASRFAIGTFSAARVGFGSSPPPPSTAGKSRTSTGGTRQLNFVGLPKKSIGLGLGLGRNWAGDSQSQSSQETTVAAPLQSVTATGAVKRKSLSSQDETIAKTPKVDTAATANQDATSAEEAAAKARRDALANRMKSMQARQSTAAGASRVSGIMGSATTFQAVVAPQATSNKPAAQQEAAAQSAPTRAAPPAPAHDESKRTDTVAGTSTVATTSSVASKPIENPPAPAARRPSVMDRVRSLEKVAASDAVPPSPSRIPSAFSRPTSPVQSTLAGLRSPSRRPPMSPSSGGAVGPSKIGSPAAAVASSSRIQFRSPVASPSRLPQHSSFAARLQEATTATNVSSTPRMSPPADLTRAKTIAQQLAQSPVRQLQRQQEQVDTIRIVSVRTEGEHTLDDVEDEDDARLTSLPLPLDQGDTAADDADDEEEVVVEKGRGALASAMDVDGPTLNGGVQGVVMPGSFGADDDTDVIEPTSNNARTLNKKVSQGSLASTTSTQSQNGGGVLSSLFGKASKKNDNGKGLKSIQMAAAAAKKEQEEKERKAAAKEEREQKRLALLQKKQDEERAKVEEERRARAELAEKKRKEREEAAAERAKLFKPKPKDDAQRIKAGLTLKNGEIGKPQSMRPPVAPSAGYQSATLSSSLNRNPLSTSQGRPGTGLSSANNTPGNNLKSSSASASTSASAQARSMVGVKFMAHPGAAGPPSAPRAAGLNHSQKGGQAQATRQAPAPPAPQAAPELEIELPEIDSEYSDSGDEAHEAKVKALPNWAQSPALAAALYRQQHVDPRDIFGPIQPLSMQEIFRSNHTRFTKRTSSAIWEGTDALTADDLARYNHAMGYQR
ncbi:hypothetical protein ACM66B_003831 [Microbotryomycetes sp. NB124-2]